MKKIFKLVIAVALPLIVGGVSSIFTQQGVNTWFTTIAKPSFNPPSWVFAPVWTTLYVLMGIALYLVWVSPIGDTTKRKAYVIFGIQLVLNFAWSVIFFSLQEPGWAFVDIILLWLSIVATMLVFRPIHKATFWLLLPYLLWVSFASVLNFAIWHLN